MFPPGTLPFVPSGTTEQVLSGKMPWSHPGLLPLQRELNHVFPTHQIRLQSDDAIVVPVVRGVPELTSDYILEE